MAQSNTPKQDLNDLFQLKQTNAPSPEANTLVHLISDKVGSEIVCDTEAQGHSRPNNLTPDQIFLEATEGFIPLWEKGTILRWRFQKRSLVNFVNPEAVREAVKQLLSKALAKWGDAAPVKFTEDNDLWDFEIVVRSGEECTPRGCVLAKAFFPDAGRHELIVYPKMFLQSPKEQVDTLIHEIGHIFGLRHFFAKKLEQDFPAENFGSNNVKFTIMEYGEFSELTDKDKSDLKELYRLVWSGVLTEINGTPIRLVKPFHTLAPTLDSTFALREATAALKKITKEEFTKYQ